MTPRSVSQVQFYSENIIVEKLNAPIIPISDVIVPAGTGFEVRILFIVRSAKLAPKSNSIAIKQQGVSSSVHILISFYPRSQAKLRTNFQNEQLPRIYVEA